MKKHFKKNLLLKVMIFQLFYFTAILMAGCQKESLVTNRNVNTHSDSVITTPATVLHSSQNRDAVAYFDAGLNKRGDLSAYSNQAGNKYTAMVVDPECISVVADPFYGKKRKVMLMDVHTGDTGGMTENPRAQVQTPMTYVEGQEVYIGFSVRFTQTFWTYFLTFSEIYGAPYKGTSPFRMAIQGSNLVASATNNGKQNNLWQEPMQKDKWYDFVYREVLSKDESKGLVQVWIRKQGETAFKELLPVTHLATITAANSSGPNYHKLACYYDRSNTFTDNSKSTKVSEIKMYLADHKVGGSFDQVAPALLK